MRLISRPKNKATLTILVTMVAVGLWIFARSYENTQTVELPQIISQSKTCMTRSNNNQDGFVVFVTDRDMADQLLTALCTDAVIDKQFGRVDIQWSHDEREIIQFVGKGIADLALVKENVMQAFATERTHGYKVVAHYQDYATYLISLREKPRIEKQYLWGKRLGLLDYPSSRSGHMVPKQMLKDLGMTVDNVDIVYAKSHATLRDLLASGEVDIISSYWQEEDNQRFSSNYITPVKNNVTGSKWYLKMETENTDLVCSVQSSLRAFADNADSDYYSNLLFAPLCPSQQPEESPDVS